ncbi:hypothetical protein [Ottowia oryzae]
MKALERAAPGARGETIPYARRALNIATASQALFVNPGGGRVPIALQFAGYKTQPCNPSRQVGAPAKQAIANFIATRLHCFFMSRAAPVFKCTASAPFFVFAPLSLPNK